VCAYTPCSPTSFVCTRNTTRLRSSSPTHTASAPKFSQSILLIQAPWTDKIGTWKKQSDCDKTQSSQVIRLANVSPPSLNIKRAAHSSAVCCNRLVRQCMRMNQNFDWPSGRSRGSCCGGQMTKQMSVFAFSLYSKQKADRDNQSEGSVESHVVVAA
jgi:hypothetical protein